MPEATATDANKSGHCTGKLADGAVGKEKVAPGAVGKDHLEDGAVTGPKLAPKAVSKDHLQDKAVGKDGKPLHGAARSAFMKKCVADTGATK